MFHTPVEAISGGKSQYYYYKEMDSIVRRIGKVLFNSIAEKSCILNYNFQKLSKSACIANSAYASGHPSFRLSTYISFTIPIVSRSRSRIESPSCMHRSRNSDVVIGRSVGRSFF